MSAGPIQREGKMRLQIVPCSLREANAYVATYHRHHKATRGHKFSIGVTAGEGLCGVAIVGRPVARLADDGLTLEVNRVCTDGTPNACSMLYGASWKAAKAMGYRRLITYTLPTEPGTSLRAAGWLFKGAAGGGSWNRKNRLRADAHSLEQKHKWEIAA